MLNDQVEPQPNGEERSGPGVIVLVDHHRPALAALARALGDGEDIAAFDNAADAIRRVRRGGVDVVVSDVTPPGMNGAELLRAIREVEPDLPVILLTASGSFASATEALELGAYRALEQPYEPEALRGVVLRAARLYALARLKREALGFAGAVGASDRAGLAANFERALGRLSIVFQPVVSVTTRTVFAYEALMRSAEATLPGPLQVLEAAERLGKVFELGRALRQRAAQLFQGASRDALLCLNLHPHELLDPALLEADSPLANIAHRVVLEVTERASLEQLEALRGHVAGLRSRGFRVAIDDLGTGGAGITSFAVLEPDVVKLDSSLVRDVADSPVKQRVVESMVTLCRQMGALVVAEGVETADERETLLELGCELQQGYLFARPGAPFPEVKWPLRDTFTSTAPSLSLLALAASERAIERGTTETRPSVLVVDDEEPLRLVMERVLTAKGMSVKGAANGNAALALVANGARFDAVVTDLHMPGLDGIGFLRAVRETDLDVPVIVLTGHASVETAIAAVEYGGFRYLQKPLEHEALVAVVKEAAAMHRVATLKRRALEVCEAGRSLIGDEAGLDAHFDRAIEKLWIAFQPIVCWADQSVYGYEALVRSTEPLLATPEQLFEAAERLGRVHDLGRAIRREVAVCAASAPVEATIFVNVHTGELSDESLYTRSAPLSSEAARVVLEVTDRAPLHRVTELRERMGRLRDLGYRVAIDNLGAGYAGLTGLSQLEPDIAKLDMALIRGVDGSNRRASIVRSMLSVWRNELGARVVCEGVETAAERDALESLGADLLQGFLFAPPEPGFRRPSVFAPAADTRH